MSPRGPLGPEPGAARAGRPPTGIRRLVREGPAALLARRAPAIRPAAVSRRPLATGSWLLAIGSRLFFYSLLFTTCRSRKNTAELLVPTIFTCSRMARDCCSSSTCSPTYHCISPFVA